MIKLIDPEIKYIPEYKEAYLLSLEEVEKGNISKHDIMFENPDEIDIIQKNYDNRDSKKLPIGYVPSYDYFLVDDDKFIGIIHIRVKLTEKLLNFGGHIGYGINPKYWHQGYGTKILKLGLALAQDIIEEDKILITCDDDNIGSSKIIETNGGILENKVINEVNGEKFLTRRYWIKKK